MAILTNTGRVAMAKAIASRPIHGAWGTGGAEWGVTPPPESTDSTALVAEVGRREAAEVGFALPDENGEIIVSNGRFTRSATPTRYLYISLKYDFNDAPDKVIRELGVFVDSEFAAGLPAGQKYFTPEQVVDGGILLHLEHRQPLYRNNATRESFDIVITF